MKSGYRMPKGPTLVLVVLSGLIALSGAELYTALIDLEALLDTETILVKTLDNYIAKQQRNLDHLRRRAEEFKKEHSVASDNVSEYLANPINAYTLVKRLTSDWKTIESLMRDLAQEVEQNMTEYKKVLKFPSDEDLSGAAVALMRLQDTYKMDTKSLARGELNGVKYSSQLTTNDCFELGRQSYNNHDYYHTKLWMEEALELYERENNITNTEADTDKWEILEYLAYSSFMQGDLKKALKLTDQLLEIYPDHQRALGNKAYYLSELEKKNSITEENSTEKQNDQPQAQESFPKDPENLTERELYEMACRGALTISPAITSKLKCRYVHFNKPYLRLAPLKEEEAYLKPRIILYRQAMTDYEIEVIKKMAQPRLKRATVQNYKTGQLETAHYRISKSAWLSESEDKVVENIARRVEDMTGLTTSTAEELQVVNYGIGGHYEPHFDFARREETNAFKSLGTGNRIATVLFYMSDVAQGGATVFPNLNLSLWPEKGTAAFWFNLHPSGEGDYSTRHAACPVLAGTKWVSNKWLHERGQEFLRPCTLDHDDT